MGCGDLVVVGQGSHLHLPFCRKFLPKRFDVLKVLQGSIFCNNRGLEGVCISHKVHRFPKQSLGSH